MSIPSNTNIPAPRPYDKTQSRVFEDTEVTKDGQKAGIRASDNSSDWKWRSIKYKGTDNKFHYLNRTSAVKYLERHGALKWYNWASDATILDRIEAVRKRLQTISGGPGPSGALPSSSPPTALKPAAEPPPPPPAETNLNQRVSTAYPISAAAAAALPALNMPPHAPQLPSLEAARPPETPRAHTAAAPMPTPAPSVEESAPPLPATVDTPPPHAAESTPPAADTPPAPASTSTKTKRVAAKAIKLPKMSEAERAQKRKAKRKQAKATESPASAEAARAVKPADKPEGSITQLHRIKMIAPKRKLPSKVPFKPLPPKKQAVNRPEAMAEGPPAVADVKPQPAPIRQEQPPAPPPESPVPTQAKPKPVEAAPSEVSASPTRTMSRREQRNLKKVHGKNVGGAKPEAPTEISNELLGTIIGLFSGIQRIRAQEKLEAEQRRRHKA